MANNVYYDVWFEDLDLTKWDDAFLTEKIEYVHGTREDLLDLDKLPFFADRGQTYNEEGWQEDSYNWYCTNVGAKWCNVEEWSEGYISGYSAWSPPVGLVDAICEYFKCSAKMTYTDEFHNFVGVSWHSHEGEYSYEEIDADMLTEQCKKEFPKQYEQFGHEAAWECDMVSERCEDLKYEFFEEGVCNYG